MRKIKSFKELKYNLRKEMNRNRLLDVSKVIRGIGKSTLLFSMASENNYKIITPTKNNAMALNKEFNTDIYHSAKGLDLLRGRRINGVLLEEGLTLDEENDCRKLFNIIGGYSSNFKGDK